MYSYTAAELGVGMGLTLLGACVLALSMVVQRYGVHRSHAHVHVWCACHAHGIHTLHTAHSVHYTCSARPPARTHPVLRNDAAALRHLGVRPRTLLHCERAQGGGAHVRPDDGTRGHAHHMPSTAPIKHKAVSMCMCMCTYGGALQGCASLGRATHVQVLSSVFSTLLVFNLLLASRVLGEAVTPPKVAGALLILAGAGITTGATPQGVPKAYTPADVRALLFVLPPYGWFVPLLLGVCVLVSVVGIPMLERRFPLGAEGELEPELMSAIESRMSMGPGLHTRHVPHMPHAHAMHTPCTHAMHTYTYMHTYSTCTCHAYMPWTCRQVTSAINSRALSARVEREI